MKRKHLVILCSLFLITAIAVLVAVIVSVLNTPKDTVATVTENSVTEEPVEKLDPQSYMRSYAYSVTQAIADNMDMLNEATDGLVDFTDPAYMSDEQATFFFKVDDTFMRLDCYCYDGEFTYDISESIEEE